MPLRKSSQLSRCAPLRISAAAEVRRSICIILTLVRRDARLPFSQSLRTPRPASIAWFSAADARPPGTVEARTMNKHVSRGNWRLRSARSVIHAADGARARKQQEISSRISAHMAGRPCFLEKCLEADLSEKDAKSAVRSILGAFSARAVRAPWMRTAHIRCALVGCLKVRMPD